MTSRITCIGPTRLLLLSMCLSLLGACGGGGGSDGPVKVPAPAWVSTGGMATSHGGGFTSTLLPNGKVLVAGGNDTKGTTISVAEIFDPATNTWDATGGMTTPRSGHAATLLSDGTVLVVGGENSTFYPQPAFQNLTSAEIYHPAVGKWAAIESFTTANPAAVTAQGVLAMLFAEGTVLLAGFSTDGTTLLATTYNPASGSWTPTTGPLRPIGSLTPLPDGTVLAAGSPWNAADPGGSEIYSPPTGAWTATSAPTYQASASTYPGTVTLLRNGNVLVAGGWYLCGEIQCVTKEAFLYDTPTGTWAPTGSVLNVLDTATLLPDGTVLAAGGGSGTDAEIYNPASGSWTATVNMTTERYGPTATLLLNGSVLVVGGAIGVNAQGLVRSTAEVYRP